MRHKRHCAPSHRERRAGEWANRAAPCGQGRIDFPIHYAIRINDEITVDVLPAAAGVPWEALREYIQDVTIDGVRVCVLSLEGLLKTKSGERPKDQIDAAAITRALDELRNA
jgi:predicted nucleotidyltransferase